MQNKSLSGPKENGLREAVVDGLLRGLGAGAIMAAFLLVTSLFMPASSRAWLTDLVRTTETSPAAIVAAHFAVAAVYGMAWGLVYRLLVAGLPLPTWVAGLLFGGVLWLISRLLLPASGGAPWLILASAHLVYGLALGLLTDSGSTRSAHDGTPLP